MADEQDDDLPEAEGPPPPQLPSKDFSQIVQEDVERQLRRLANLITFKAGRSLGGYNLPPRR